MRPNLKISIGALMIWITILAVQLGLFQEVWFIVVIPPVTMVTLAINLGLCFLIVRPTFLDTRIIGMLLGSIVAGVVTILPLTPKGIALSEQVEGELVNWILALPDQDGPFVAILLFFLRYKFWFAAIVIDIIGLAIIWSFGRMEHGLRGRWARPLPPMMAVVAPLDDRAASPL